MSYNRLRRRATQAYGTLAVHKQPRCNAGHQPCISPSTNARCEAPENIPCVLPACGFPCLPIGGNVIARKAFSCQSRKACPAQFVTSLGPQPTGGGDPYHIL